MFRQILSGYKDQEIATRKGLAIRNNLRPATVTQLIGEMIQSGLIIDDTVNHQPGPGRPEVDIIPSLRQLTAIFICIDARTWSRVLANIYFILFPDVIIFSGPFTHNDALFNGIIGGFNQRVPDYFEQNVIFTINHKSFTNEMNGALSPFFEKLVTKYCQDDCAVL